jgi:hypothetical protein
MNRAHSAANTKWQFWLSMYITECRMKCGIIGG